MQTSAGFMKAPESVPAPLALHVPPPRVSQAEDEAPKGPEELPPEPDPATTGALRPQSSVESFGAGLAPGTIAFPAAGLPVRGTQRSAGACRSDTRAAQPDRQPLQVAASGPPPRRQYRRQPLPPRSPRSPRVLFRRSAPAESHLLRKARRSRPAGWRPRLGSPPATLGARRSAPS